jgi:hypothetical protein
LKSKANQKIEMIKFKYLPHGLLNLAVPKGLPQAYAFEKKNIDLLKELFRAD